MFDLSMFGVKPPEAFVTLRGQQATLRPVTAVESRAIREAFPPPERVKTPDGRIASEDPRQIEAETWRGVQCMAAELLVASGTVEAHQTVKLLEQVKVMTETLTTSEITEAWGHLRRAGKLDPEDARKN